MYVNNIFDICEKCKYHTCDNGCSKHYIECPVQVKCDRKYSDSYGKLVWELGCGGVGLEFYTENKEEIDNESIKK